MKVILAFGFLITCVSATIIPDLRLPIGFPSERVVSGQIENAIENLCQAIKEAGLDPFHIKKETSSYELPVPVIFNYEAVIEELLSTGLSDIKTHRINYNVITNRLTFDVELPLIHFSAATAKADAVVFSNDLDFQASGKIEIVSVRVSGSARVNFSVISGISIRNLNIELVLGDINSDVKLVVMGKDYSDGVNNFVGIFVPDTIKDHNKEINELLEIVAMAVIEANL